MWRWLVICLRALRLTSRQDTGSQVFNSWAFCYSASFLCPVTVPSCQFTAEPWICQRRQCCWSDISQSLENCVSQVLWNLYDKWPLRDLAVWKHITARTMENCVGTTAFCLSADTSPFPCFTTVLKMFMLHEYQTQGFSFFHPMINMKISVEHIITNLF